MAGKDHPIYGRSPSLASTDAANPFAGAHGVVLAHPPSLENQRPDAAGGQQRKMFMNWVYDGDMMNFLSYVIDIVEN